MKINVTNKQFKDYKKIRKRLSNGVFKMALTDKSNYLAGIDNDTHSKFAVNFVKHHKINLKGALGLAKESDQHTSMLLKCFNLGKNSRKKIMFES